MKITMTQRRASANARSGHALAKAGRIRQLRHPMPLSVKTTGPNPGSALVWQILAPLMAAFVLLLILAALTANLVLLPRALDRDLGRILRDVELSRLVVENRPPQQTTESALKELRATGLQNARYVSGSGLPKEKSPRYLAASQEVEAWAVVKDRARNTEGYLILRRDADMHRIALATIRIAFLSTCCAFSLLIVLGWILLERRVIRRVEALAHDDLKNGTSRTEGDAIDLARSAIHRRFEEADASHKWLRRLLEGHRELACIRNPEGTLIQANAACCQFFGMTREQLLETNFFDLILPADRIDAIGSLRDLSPGNPESTFEHRVMLPDGNMRWMRWRNTAVFGAGDKIKEVFSFGSDVTPEKDLAAEIDALRIAFDQMQSLAETGSLTWDLSLDQMEWTPETRRLLGLNTSTPASLESLLAVVTPDDRETVRRLFLSARGEGREFEQEFRAVLPDGSVRVLQTRAEVLADPKTKLLNYLTCTLRDITTLRDAEAATKRELRFREAIEQSLAAGIVVSDEKGRNELVNPAFCEMTGMSREDLVGATAPYPYWPEEEIPAIHKAFELAIGGKTPPAGFELKFCRKDGTRFDVLVKVAPLLDSDDEQLGWLAVVSDISSIQQTRRELANTGAALRAQLAYRQAVEKSTTVGAIAIDTHGRPFAANDTLCKMLGYTEEEILTFSPPYPYWPEKDHDKIQRALALHIEGQGPPEGFQFRFQRKDGSPVDVLITAAKLQEPDGKTLGILSTITDVSPIKSVERELSITNERLRIAQDCMGLGIWDWNPDADTLFWDENSFAIFGHPEATNAKEVWKSVHGEQERERLTSELQRLMAAGGASGQDHLRIRWPDGTKHHILSTYVILRDDSGKANRVVGVNRDITAEMEEQQDLRNAQERLSAALEGAQFGTFEHAVGVGDVNWSAANYEINGIDPSITEPAELFAAWKEVAGAFYPKLMVEMHALPVGQTSHSYEFTARPPAKEPRRVRVSVFIERDEQGHAVKLVGVSRRADA